MSYQVLARKWRPQNFRQMVGQEHVLQALIHALESQRLHHAYLFTGTRGVGKTTIGRILAKCLSCEGGVSPEPCGRCGACQSIAQGRYVDLIEIDAASRTKVEDMRELLDNVQYAPSQGQYKIYLIDEVHMLSQSSFNALLKTLEEPPEHVKFLFATTDPQKLPVTILSRCLQFNLKNMSPERIVQHLSFVLAEEQIGFEEPALWALARAADGSMRDALSLTDQAIAYGNQQLTEQGVSAMLGTVDQKQIYRIVEALVHRDAARMLEEVSQLAEFSPDYREVLASLVALLHRIAIEQAVPGATDNAMGDQEYVRQYAGQLSAEDVQLYYQIALTSRQDLSITPDPRSGFEMALLRMLAFQLQAPEEQVALGPAGNSVPDESPSKAGQGETNPAPVVQEPALPESDASLPSQGERAASEAHGEYPLETSAPVAMDLSPPDYRAPPVEAYEDASSGMIEEAEFEQPDIKKKTDLVEAEPALPSSGTAQHMPLTDSNAPQVADSGAAKAGGEPDKAESGESAAVDPNSWPVRAAQVPVSGMTQNLLLNMALVQDNQTLRLFVDPGHYRLLNDNHRKRIQEALCGCFMPQEKAAEPLQVEFIEGLQPGQETPMMWRERRRAEMQTQARALIQSDDNVRQLIEIFDAHVIEESIEALGALH